MDRTVAARSRRYRAKKAGGYLIRVRFTEAQIARLDAIRGDTTREVWIASYCARGLTVTAPDPIAGKKPERNGTSNAQAVASPVTVRPAVTAPDTRLGDKERCPHGQHDGWCPACRRILDSNGIPKGKSS